MTFTAKTLAEGNTSTSGSYTLYTVPVATTAYVRTIIFGNRGTASVVITAYLKPGSTDRFVRNVALGAKESVELVDFNAWCLSAGTEINIDFDNAGVTGDLDFVITGVEET